MVRKQPLSSLFYTVSSANKDTTPPSSPPTPTVTQQAWMWPSCKHPTTNSFRAPSASAAAATAVAKNAASLFVDSAESSSFTNSSARMHHDCAASDSLSTESEPSAEDTADAIVRGLRSDRLRFEPRAPSSSILEKKQPARGVHGPSSAAGPFGGGVPLAFDSADPYEDFRASMAEMMTAHGASGDWDWLERMLGWYLRANGKDTHAAIVAAFVDLVVTRTAACPSSSGHSSSFTLAGSDLESGSTGGNGSFRLRRTKSSVSG